MARVRQEQDIDDEVSGEDAPVSRAGAGGGIAAPPAGPSAGGAKAPQRAGTGFLNLRNLLSLNQESGQAKASQLAGDLDTRAGNMHQDALGVEQDFQSQLSNASGPTRMSETKGYGAVAAQAAGVEDRTRAMQTSEGRQGLLREGGANGGEAAATDFFMGANNPVFGEAQKRYGNIGSMLGMWDNESAGQGKGFRNQPAAPAIHTNEANRKAAIPGPSKPPVPGSGGRGNLQSTTSSMTDDQVAAADGNFSAWNQAGRPPYDEWKKNRKGMR